MNNPLSKTPFLFLLLPLIVGIILQYYFGLNKSDENIWGIASILVGGLAMLLSYRISSTNEFRFRWLFGLGTAVLILGIGVLTTSNKQQQASIQFSNKAEIYKGIVLDIPKEKAKTQAYHVKLADLNKQIIAYVHRDSLSMALSPGDVILFRAKLQPFKNRGNPDDFDYVAYMKTQGYSATAYLASGNWMKTDEVYFSLKTIALNCRKQILSFYQSLGFNDNEYAILSALTLGYQDALSDDIKQAFRTTGTVHVLSVSGLHVGIIYVIISFLLSFIKRNSKYYWLKPSLIILFLWCYAFITGLSPSVIRASAMLTVFCTSEILNRKHSSIHSIYIAAFFILLIDPMALFDIGFQLSFVSVAAILYLHPALSNSVRIKNKVLRYIWQLFTLSLVAQLGAFPLCLYYFGTFPTYFFATNLLIVPLVSLITYAFGGIVIAKLLTLAFPSYTEAIYFIPVKILQFLVEVMTKLIRFFEQLPGAQIENISISLLELVIILLIIVSMVLFILGKKARVLIVGLSGILLLISFNLYDRLFVPANEFVVYNRYGATELKWNVGRKHYQVRNEDVDKFHYFDIGTNSVLVITESIENDKYSDQKFRVDYLLPIGNDSLSLYSLTKFVKPQVVLLDGSLPVKTVRRLKYECNKLQIPYYDVTEKGAFRLNF